MLGEEVKRLFMYPRGEGSLRVRERSNVKQA